MPGGSKKGGGLETKKSTFYLKSGNSPLFKTMGSSPLKQVVSATAEGKPKLRMMKREFKKLKPITMHTGTTIFGKTIPEITKGIKKFGGGFYKGFGSTVERLRKKVKSGRSRYGI